MNTNEPRSDASAAATDNASGHEPVVSEVVLRCIEALLMASDGPLSVDQIVRLLETTHAVERADVRVALAALAENYAANAVNVVEVAGGWRFQVGADYAGLVSRLWEERPPKLSRAMLETLALICYRQPIARSDIEAVRGVSVSSNIVKTLQEFDWIKVVGYRDMPGRPALFGTTTKFLDDFGVKRLSDLPSLPEIKDLDALDAAIARLQGDSPSSETGEIGETGESGAEDEPETDEAGDPSGESASPGDEPSDTDNTGPNRPPSSDSVH
ncbi:SMC-Scp complex subunit ScpB [Endozoicomonas sp. G2_2]|uniref:SMC-Scp complex subunit ScpB n=1 Tax=Endozoicomonas sp. G2_2 TaxID=2821092 RepID=UPI0032AF9EA5